MTSRGNPSWEGIPDLRTCALPRRRHRCTRKWQTKGRGDSRECERISSCGLPWFTLPLTDTMREKTHLRDLLVTHAIIVAICCTILVTGILAEDTLPPPGGGTPNQAPQKDNPTQQGGVGAAGPGQDGEVAEPSGKPVIQNEPHTTDDSIKTVESDDVTSGSPSSPPEGISSPQPPSGSDGHQHSQLTQGNPPDVTSGQTRPDIPTGGTTEPVAPSGEEKVKQGDAKQDSASVSSETKEPGTPGVEEKQTVDANANPTDGKKTDPASNDQVADSTDQPKPEDQPTEEVKGEDGTKEPQASEDVVKVTPPEHEAEEKMPSFDEWKQKMLAEQAEQAKQAKQVKLEAQGLQPVSGTVQKAKSNNRINYASMSCGAKLIAANPEAKNSGFILTENKDQYMIQPCAAKKWFVVELCEPVAVQNIELANLELFSSLPESFIVHIAERYPTKDWKMLGTFQARDQRAVQTFPIIDEELFAKYIKVEPLTHYGVEHYCPLTILRVYGTTAVEDYEDQEHHDTSAEDEDHATQTPESPKEPSNLFTSATENSGSGSLTSLLDTVISLVKTVLSPGEKGKEGETEKGIVHLNGTARNQSAGNTIAPVPKGDQAAPCTPTALSGDAGPGKDPPVGMAHPETPHVTDKPPLVTLIESHPHCAATLSSLINKCNFCQDVTHPVCYAGRNTLCGYYKVTNFVRGTTCVDRKKQGPLQARCQQTPKITKPSTTQTKGTKPVTTEEPKKARQPQTQQDKPAEKKNDKVPSEKPIVSTDAKTPPTGKPDATTTISEVSLEPSQGVTTKDKPKETHREVVMTQTPLASDSGTDTQSVAASLTGTTANIHTKPTLTASGSSCDSASTDCGTMGPDIVQIRPTTTEEAMRTDHPERNIGDQTTDQLHPTPTKTASTAEATKVTGTQSVGTASENKTNGNGKVIYAEAPSQEEYDLETVPPPEDGEPYQKLSSGRRETAFMRLRNRINALELNLNLSSRYLEELSQRYRRQMENMYLSLNKTIQKLTNTSRTAEQRDLRQQSNITELMKRINYLTEQTQRLTENFNDIHTQVIERHLFLMMIEGIVFLLLITWLLNKIHATPGRIRHPTPSPTGVAQSRGQQPAQTSLRPAGQNTKPPDKQKKPVHKVQHKRRNSIDATPPRPRVSSIVSKQRSKDDIGLRLSGSEGRLGSEVLSAVAAAAANAEFKEIVNRKKKKKKANRSLQLASQSSSVLQNSSGSSSSSGGLHTSSSNTRVHHNAGLIFTSKGSRDTSPPNSTASSESGDSIAGTVSTTSSRPLSAVTSVAGLRNNKLGARRSLDLRDMQKGATNHMSKKSHKRQRSEGTLNPNGSQKNSVTNIGPTHSHSNGKMSPKNGPSEQSGWKSWLIGSRR